MHQARKIIRTLETSGHEAVFVGGCVRDILLGVTPHDFDIATSASVEEIISIFPNAAVIESSKGSRICKIQNVEISSYKGDTLEQDLLARDYTVNAIAMNVEGRVIASHPTALDDLNGKVLRLVTDSPSPIMKDPLRIVRGCRFLSQLEGVFAQRTRAILTQYSYLLVTIPAERLQSEIMKAMITPIPSLFWGALAQVGALHYIIPELEEQIGACHGKWHKETIWEHSMLVGDDISSKYPLLRLAGYLHDIGKVKAQQKNEDNSFKEHNVIGETILRDRLKRLKFSNSDIDYLCGLTRCHMWTVRKAKSAAIRRFLRKLNSYGLTWREWLRLAIADVKGNVNRKQLTLSEIKVYVRKLRDVSRSETSTITPKSLAVSGKELIREFGLQPGPIVGRIQKHLVEFVISTGVNDKSILLQEARKFLEVVQCT